MVHRYPKQIYATLQNQPQIQNNLPMMLFTYARKQKLDFEKYSDDSSPPRIMFKSDDAGLFNFMTPTKGRKKHISGDIVTIEISQYLFEPRDDACEPLKFLNDHTEIYPILTKFAHVASKNV